LAEFGVPTAGQLEKINMLAKRTLSADEVFVFPNKLAGDMVIPERYIQLHKTLLEVFKQDAIKGVSLMVDHSWAPSGLFGMGGRPRGAFTYGRSFDAKLRHGDTDSEKWALDAWFYMVKGMEIDGINTNSLIQGIESGTLFDTSIGWGADTHECSICHKDIRRYSECEHYPGKTYDVNGEEKLCWDIAKPPGFLMEDSLVFDGAYPTAGVLSAIGEGGQGVPSPFAMVENIKEVPFGVRTYHIMSAGRETLITYAKKDDIAKGNVFTVPDLSNLKGGGKQVSEDVKTYTQEEVDALVKDAADKAVADALAKTAETGKEIGEALKSIELYMTQQDVVDKLGKELPADKVLSYAKEGESYMTQLIDDAVAMGVRAQGNDFPAETWKNTFAGMSSQGIKDIMATFEKQAKDEIPAGRQTQAGAGKEIFSKNDLPDDAFKA
jgi:hypothetical protein